MKVTPSSKVVGDLALALVGAGVSADEFAADPARFDIPDSVIGFLRGELGDPPGGWPEPLRTKALDGRPPARPQLELTADDEAALAVAGTQRQATLNRLLFPGPTKEFGRGSVTSTATPRNCQRTSSSTGCDMATSIGSISSGALNC